MVSACTRQGYDIFDCSLCTLNHSVPRHVNEAIHRRVARAARFGREFPPVGGTSPCEACLANVRYPLGPPHPQGGFSFLSSASLPLSHRACTLIVSPSPVHPFSDDAGRAIFRGKTRNTRILARRIFSRPEELYIYTPLCPTSSCVSSWDAREASRAARRSRWINEREL